MYQQVVVCWIQFVVLVVGYYLCRNVCGVQDESYCFGVMCVEVVVCVEQEIVYFVGIGCWWFQGVGERFVVEVL